MSLKNPASVSPLWGDQIVVHSNTDGTVVWVRGTHDMATVPSLEEAMARAVTLDDSDVVVDLSGVEFMDASTIGAIVRTRNLLGRGSRGLVVRAPSPFARRVLECCGMADLVDPGELDEGSAAALATWVAVPATGRDHDANSVRVERAGEPDRVPVPAVAAGSVSGSGRAVDELRHESG